MNTKAEGTLPAMDDMPAAEPTEQSLLDAVLRGSEFLKGPNDVPLPDEDDFVEVPEESEYDDDDDSDEAVSG